MSDGSIIVPFSEVTLNLAESFRFLNSIFILSISDAYTDISGNSSSCKTSKLITLTSISSSNIASSSDTASSVNSTILFGIGILF